MIKNKVELWEEPAKCLKEKTDFLCEMDSYEHAFLCGMIREKRPKKLIEIGVAEGGTTAVIINALSLLEKCCEVYSVDLSPTLYYDNKKKTGYEFDRLSSNIDMKNIIHHFLLGDTIASQIEKLCVGKDIDFVVIDTTHKLPGEIMDFLCVLPFLNKGATVVLHDVNLNYIRAMYGIRSRIISSKESIATKLLLSTVVAKKYFMLGKNEIPNIAAFTITEDTYKNVISLFYLLTLTWSYIPEGRVLDEYRVIYKKYYDEESLYLYDIAIANNQKISGRMKLAEMIQEDNIIKYRFPYETVPIGSKIVLYGAGTVGQEIYEAQMSKEFYQIAAWVDRDYEKYRSEGLNVQSPAYIAKIEFDFIVVTVEEENTFYSIQRDIITNGWDQGRPIVGPVPRC